MARPKKIKKSTLPERGPNEQAKPFPRIDYVPNDCPLCKAGKMEFHGEATNTIPRKWQFTCEACGQSVMSTTPPPGWQTKENARIAAARRAEEDARLRQKIKLETMGGSAA